MLKTFKSYFQGHKDIRFYLSPGRVNLIGEHIDYHGGYVLPAAIDLGTCGVVGARKDRLFRFFSLNFKDEPVVKCSLDDLSFSEEDGWVNYAKGILWMLLKEGFQIDHGFDLLVNGDLPTASGLSSSASFELLVAYIANDLYGFDISRNDLALLAQRVENEYMGMHCGIMDQIAVALGQKDLALLTNTATLEVEPIRAVFPGYRWVIMNTNYQRKTTDSKYNERRNESHRALLKIKEVRDIEHLCELSVEEFEKVKHVIDNPIELKRARHAVSEQARVLAAKKALEAHDVEAFGQLLNESHLSLKEDYEVTGKHLDALVKSAITHGAAGARVTGAGFGGCAIALVEENAVDSFISAVEADYIKKIQLEPSFYSVEFTDGVRRVESCE
ncbi:MAG: galactokinase [Acholeplasmataceae bacterium]